VTTFNRLRPTAETLAEQRLLYTRIADEFPDAVYPGDIPWAWWSEYEKEVSARRGVRGYRTVALMDWYGRQDLYDPTPDPVAVERALRFERSALEHLTIVEWFKVVDALAGMEWYKGEYVQKNEGGRQWVEGDLRWEAFNRLPLRLRDTIERAVMRARKEAGRG
jgi:hypothetical protein